MLESMRNQAQSWIAKIILGGIALSFALWGVGDYFMGSQIQTIAEVDGKPISDSVFYQSYERELNNYRAMLGKQFSKEMVEQLGLKEQVIQTLINRKLMLDEAARMGLAAPEAALMASVQANPAFQSANGFDANRYKIMTRNMGFRTTRDYEDEQRVNLMIDALQKAVVNSGALAIMKSEANSIGNFKNECFQPSLLIQPACLKRLRLMRLRRTTTTKLICKTIAHHSRLN